MGVQSPARATFFSYVKSVVDLTFTSSLICKECMELCHHSSCTCTRRGDWAVEQPCILLLTLQSSVAVQSWPPQIGTLPMPLKFTTVQGQANILNQFHILRQVNRPINPLLLSTIICSMDDCRSLHQYKWIYWYLLIGNFVRFLLWVYRHQVECGSELSSSTFKYRISISRGIIWIKWEKID